MANADRPSGGTPVQYMNGSCWEGQARVYCVPSGELNALAVGDPVDIAGGADANGVPTVTLATAGDGNPLIGFIVATKGVKGNPLGFSGPFADPTDLNSTIIPATKTKDYYVLVADDPNLLFEIQEVSGGTALTAAEVGLNANLVSGANNGFVSGWEVSNNGEATTATFQLRLERLAPRPDNAFGEHAKWWVRIQNHRLVGSGAAGV